MPNDLDHARGWVRKGDSDLSAARQIVAAGGPFDTACFHAQQAAEKFLKAVLALLGQPIPRTHNIEDVADLCERAGSGLALSIEKLVVLSPYAVEMRYDFEFWPEEDSARQAISIAEDVRGRVAGRFPELTSG